LPFGAAAFFALILPSPLFAPALANLPHPPNVLIQPNILSQIPSLHFFTHYAWNYLTPSKFCQKKDERHANTNLFAYILFNKS
jgi:hypothetical protein